MPGGAGDAEPLLLAQVGALEGEVAAAHAEAFERALERFDLKIHRFRMFFFSKIQRFFS